MTTPTPATIPGAGLPLSEALRRQELAADAPVPEPATRAKLRAALEDPDQVVILRPDGTFEGTRELTAAEKYEWPALLHADAGTAGIPEDDAPGTPEPGPTHAPVGLNRYQDIRDRALGHAIRFYEQDPQTEVDDQEVIATADRFADWIRRGYHL